MLLSQVAPWGRAGFYLIADRRCVCKLAGRFMKIEFCAGGFFEEVIG